ncbi:cytochrome P450 [Rothia uropygialis]|uniref:cytochrome P450 n=1 Tax=Kocuria sp. 36 TaxID=1415402 RepID=UPI00101CBE90|nr:cytochrome P450 [Kocuria sp. 36]
MPASIPHQTVPTVADLDLFSDEVLQDSMPTYVRLREMAPVVYLPACDLWVITRYEEVREALGNTDVFSSTGVAFNDTMNEALAGTSLATDPPGHQKLRDALTENLSPRAVRKMKDGIFAKADALVGEVASRGEIDGMEELAKVFPVSIVMDLIGVQGEVRERLLSWGEAAFNMQGPLNDRALDSFPVAQELFDWTHEQIVAEDLMEGSIGRGVFEAAERGQIPYESCGMIIHQYIAAGMDTTITSIGNAIVLLGRYPEQFQRLRDKPELASSAFNEVQRFLAPIPVLGRRALSDVDVGGTTIPAGSQTALLVAASNRDPRHYENPEEFLIERNPVDHLSFGYGTHTCAGQGLARLEAHGILAALAGRIESYAVGQTMPRINNITRPYRYISMQEIVPTEGRLR